MNRLIVVAIGPALFGLGCAGSSNGSSSGGPPDRAPCGGVVAESTGAVRLASTPASQPIAIAADATNVYWTTYGSDPSQPGLVLKVPVVGGTPTTLATARTARVIAVDAANVYWGDTECNFTGGICAIMKVPISGGAATTLAALQSMPVGIVVTSDAIYWADSGTGSGRIMSLPLTGGAPVTLALDPLPTSIAVDATSVYWTSLNTVAAVSEAPLTGGPPLVLADSPANTSDRGSVVVDATNVYWTETLRIDPPGTATNSVMTVPKAGHWPITLASRQQDNTEASLDIALEGTDLYWPRQDAVLRVSTAGGQSVTLAQAQCTVDSLAVNPMSVFWLDSSDRTVLRLPRQ